MADTQTTTPEWPPDWWDFGPDEAGGHSPRAGVPDLAPLFMMLEGLRRTIPAELQEQFTTLVRELLLALRALIDWYVQRMDEKQPEPAVEDIPIS
jgi:hypothetical protein